MLLGWLGQGRRGVGVVQRCEPNEDALKYVRHLAWWLWSRVISKTINPSNNMAPVVVENDASMVTLLAVMMQLVSQIRRAVVLGTPDDDNHR